MSPVTQYKVNIREMGVGGVGWGRRWHVENEPEQEPWKVTVWYYLPRRQEDGHSMTITNVNTESRRFKGTMPYANLTRLLSDPTHR